VSSTAGHTSASPTRKTLIHAAWPLSLTSRAPEPTLNHAITEDHIKARCK